jgi:tetratricopeptide (TPR) repeat protein
VLALRHRGRLRLLAGDLAGAAADIDEAFVLSQTMPETLEFSPTLLAMAELMFAQGQTNEALTLAEQSLDHARPLDQMVEALIVLARLQLARSDRVRAYAYATEAVAQAVRRESPRLLGHAYLVMALSTPEEDGDAASAAYQHALHQMDVARDPHGRSVALSAYAGFLRKAGVDPDLASATKVQAEAILAELDAGLRSPTPAG